MSHYMSLRAKDSSNVSISIGFRRQWQYWVKTKISVFSVRYCDRFKSAGSLGIVAYQHDGERMPITDFLKGAHCILFQEVHC